MSIIRMIVIAAVLLVTPKYADADLLYARISLIEGDVQIKTPDSGDYGPASINGPVSEGDELWVPGGGRVELQLENGTYIRLDQESALQILSLQSDSSQFYLSKGHAYIYSISSGRGVIQFDTPDASTRAYETAVFRIDIPDQYTDVAVYKGYVETENDIGTTTVNADFMISLGRDTNGEVAPMGPPDEWERWNKQRNDQIFGSRGVSNKYLPDELREYSYDFDNNGRWVDVPDYGWCWTPTAIVYQDWAPYRHGRWIWRGGDYIWVGYESWGWAPYHYGRWAHVGGYGWCWVPPLRGDVYWGPGYVGWVRTGAYVAWVPLAPRETYYGRGHYGRHSVNIRNANIAQINVNVYRNVHVGNSVTVIDRRTFATASPKMVRLNKGVIDRDIFIKKNISVVGPEVKPTRASYFGSDKRIPSSKMPPQHIRNISVKELKENRPLVRERNRSVMRRGAGTEALPVIKESAPRSPNQGRPALQKFRPDERGRTVAPSTIPEQRPERRMERREVQPPPERKTTTGPEVRPEQRMERRETKPPTERGRPEFHETPSPRIERREAPPSMEQRKPEVRGTVPGPAIERREAQPQMERGRQAAPEVRQERRIERRETQPASERRQPESREAAPESKGESRQPDFQGGPRGEQGRQRFEERGR